jgi:hypothetical protein
MLRELLAGLSILSMVACSSSAAEEPATAGAALEGVSTPQSGGTCVLQAKYATAACDACMHQNCCTETDACFAGNKDCTDLHSCVAACPADHTNFFIAVGGDGSPSAPPDDGSGNSFGSSDSACIQACEGAHAASIQAHRAYAACIATRCMPACAGG